MRTLLTLAFVIGLSFSLHAQISVRDSVRYYRKLESAHVRRIWDSIANNDSVRLLNDRLQHLRNQSRSYFAFSLFGEVAGADFNSFNKSAAQDGFGALTGPVWRFGFGFSRKTYSGIMLDLNYAIFGIERSVKTNGNTITANFTNLLGLELGYAVVNGKRFDIYPYAGLSARSTSLSYSTPSVVNPNYRSIASLITNNRSASGAATNLGYEAGLSIEYAIYYNKKTHGGTMLFGKFGTDGIFGKENYSISDIDYHSGIQYGAWIAELGFKFFGR